MRAADGQPTLAAILTAAGELASLEGLERLSMRRLAATIGMSKSAIYSHFASKEELQLATIEYALNVWETEVVLDPTDEGLPGLLDRWVAFFEDRVFPGGCFLIVGAVEFAGRPGAVRDALAKAIDREIEALETAVLRTRDTGDAQTGKDAGQTAFELHSILMNAHALFQIRRDPIVFDRARAALAGVLRSR